MNEKRFNWGAAALAVFVALVLMFAVVRIVSGTPDESGNTDTIFIASCSTNDKVDAVRGVMVAQGFDTDEFVVGEENFVLTAESTEVGSGAFATKAQVTEKGHMAWLKSGTPQANATVAFHAKKTGASKAQVLNPANWYGVQIKVSSTLSGNTVYQNGKVVAAGTRKSAAGDIVWVFVPPSSCKDGVVLVKMISYQRAGCENPQHNPPKPTPPRPGPKPTPPPGPGPKPTPTPTHTKPTPTPTPTHCVKPPKPSNGYHYNPETCKWVKDPPGTQSDDCMLNGGPTCPPNGGHQPPQDNPGQPTGPSGPSQEPQPLPTAPAGTTPAPNPSGYDGGPSGAPGPAPSNAPDPVHTATETAMAPHPA